MQNPIRVASLAAGRTENNVERVFELKSKTSQLFSRSLGSTFHNQAHSAVRADPPILISTADALKGIDFIPKVQKLPDTPAQSLRSPGAHIRSSSSDFNAPSDYFGHQKSATGSQTFRHLPVTPSPSMPSLTSANSYSTCVSHQLASHDSHAASIMSISDHAHGDQSEPIPPNVRTLDHEQSPEHLLVASEVATSKNNQFSAISSQSSVTSSNGSGKCFTSFTPSLCSSLSAGPNVSNGTSTSGYSPHSEVDIGGSPTPESGGPDVVFKSIPSGSSSTQTFFPRTVSSSVSNLSGLADIRTATKMRTSLPNSQISRDLDYSMSRLLNESVFEEFLDDALGRQRFRVWLVRNEGTDSVAKLDMWLDTRSYGRIINAAKMGSIGIRDMYLAPGSTGMVHLPSEEQEEVFGAIEQVTSLAVSFDSTQRHLLNSLYHHEFQRFVKQRIVSQAQVTLGKLKLRDEDRNGLGDSFCLTNPRMRDHPIVMVSEGFTRVTGYERSQIIGRNCRFLQGPSTSPQAVQRIRDGLNSGKGCTELLLNYRRDGIPFYCLLCILPLRDVSGSLIYFIGGQINVTRLLKSKNGLSSFIGEPTDGVAEVEASEAVTKEFGNGEYALSPRMHRFVRMEKIGKGRPVDGSMSASAAKREMTTPAAGYHETFQTDLTKTASRRRGLFFSRRSIGCEAHDKILNQLGSQRSLGAEKFFSEPRPLDSQIELFGAVYSKLVVFKRDTREIIFASQSLVHFFDIPCDDPKNSHRSSLIHCDFAQLLWSMTPKIKDSNRKLRNEVREVIRRGLELSQECQVKSVERSFFSSSGERLANLKHTRIHLTPMLAQDAPVTTYVCVFG